MTNRFGVVVPEVEKEKKEKTPWCMDIPVRQSTLPWRTAVHLAVKEALEGAGRTECVWPADLVTISVECHGDSPLRGWQLMDIFAALSSSNLWADDNQVEWFRVARMPYALGHYRALIRVTTNATR